MARFDPKPFALKSGDAITIRSAVAEDVPALIELSADAISTTEYLVTDITELERDPAVEGARITELIEKDNWIALIAVADGRPIGRLNFRANPKKRLAHAGSIGMYAHSQWRGRGVGRALLTAVADWAASHPSLEILNLGVMAPNAAGLHLYESMGFIREEWRRREFKLGPGRYSDDIKLYRPVKPLTGVCAPSPRLDLDLHAPPDRPPHPPQAIWSRTAAFTGRRDVTLHDGTNITIRQPEEHEAAVLVAHGSAVLSTSDYNATTIEEFHETYTEEKEREWIREMRGSAGNLALVATHAGRFIGSLAFRAGTRMKLAHHGHFGIGITDHWRGRGVGRAMIECLLDWAADHPALEKVCLGVLAPNTRAHDLYHRIGFRSEGLRTRGCKLAPDRYCDGVEMSIFVKRW